jgi:hypothetical protein
VIPDDAPVSDETILFRRVHPDEVVWDDNDKCARPNSGVFKDVELSIHLGDVLEDDGREPVAVLDGKPHHCLVGFTTKCAQEQEQEVKRSHMPTDDSHGEVVGAKPKARRRYFSRESYFAVFRRGGLRKEVVERLDESRGTASPA